MISFFVCLVVLIVGFFTYGKIAEKVFGSDDRTPPSLAMTDGADYVPMSTPRVFLIQLLNIAGLGPIFGALAGACWGPSVFLWITLGTIFAGAVHDFMIGMMSMRHKGASVSELTGTYLGKGMLQVMRVFSVVLLVLVGVTFSTGPANLLAMLTPKVLDTKFWLVVVLIYYFIATFVPIDKVIGKIYPVFGICLIVMALGVGVASIRSDENAKSDSFGLVALCSIGPILSVLILGMIYNPEGAGYTPLSIPDIASTRELWLEFGHALPDYAKEVLLALAPILAFFVVFQVFFLKLRRKALVKILVGMLYTLVGLTLFLTGVNVGFMPAGNYIGKQLAELPYNWVLVPLGMLIGYYIVKAEPAVLVLNKQVEEITGGAISQKVMMAGLSIGMSVSLGLSMVRVLTGVSLLWFLVPGYALALGLSFLVPKIFTAIAFDSGGVASGPMTATFLLPFAMGACEAVGGNILTDAFGIVAMVAMTPLITIQIIGLVYQFKTRRAPAAAEVHAVQDEEIIEFGVSAGEDAT